MGRRLRVLLVDNYDSFTYNLYQYLGEILGEPPRVVLNDDRDGLAWADDDAIVLSPGPGHPAVGADFGLCRDLIHRSGKPILGVCLGHQGIILAEGGDIGPAPEPFHGRVRQIRHSGHPLFAGIPDTFPVVRYHSLIAKDPIPPSFDVIARSESGLVMAVAHQCRPQWGVQFHPESIHTVHGMQLLRNFVDLAGAYVVDSANESRRSVCLSRSEVAPRSRPPRSRPPRLNPSWSCRYRDVSGVFDPERVFGTLFCGSEHSFWLDSAHKSSRDAYHYLGSADGPHGFSVSYSLGGPVVQRFADGRTIEQDQDIYDFLASSTAADVTGTEDLPFAFAGGLVGYLGYELKELSVRARNRHHSKQPDAYFLFCDRFLAIRKDLKRVYFVELSPGTGDSRAFTAWVDRSLERLNAAGWRIPTTPARRSPVVFELEQNEAAYRRSIDRALEEIRAGESYEVCLTNRLRARQDVDPWDLYRALRTVNSAPYAAYLKFGDLHILSSSPERFLKSDADGTVESKPIKGTRPRDDDPAVDAQIARSLATNEKDLAENLMIVDLIRNDLGRICEIGSVRVPELMKVETYETVHQLVSTVRGRLRQPEDAMPLLRSMFPGGSMTGAPKERTLEILDSLEESARGVYSGGLGYLSLNGRIDLGIVIRTVVLQGNEVEIGTGGAIVSLSDPDQEFAETLIKAEALLRAVALAATGDETNFVLVDRGGHRVDIAALTDAAFYDLV